MKSNKPDTFLVLALHWAKYTHKPVCFKLSRDNYSSNLLKGLEEFTFYFTKILIRPTKPVRILSSLLFNFLPSRPPNRIAYNVPLKLKGLQALKMHKRLGLDSLSVTLV